MRTPGRAAVASAGLFGLLVAVVTASAGVGPVPVPARNVLAVVANAVAVPVGFERVAGATSAGLAGTGMSVRYVHPFSFPVPAVHETIVMTVRLPRIALGALVGVALAAGFGVYLIATRDGRTPVATLLLAGVAVQTLLGAVVSYMLLGSGESMRRVVHWLMGHLANATWDDVTSVAVLVPVLVLVLMGYARDLNVLLLGEGDAGALGVNVERTKRTLLAVSAVLTAAAVAVSGVIGFVGLVVPHVMRLLVGPDHRILLPTSALAGGSFLVAADTVARGGAAEVPVGIVTAAAGAPFFLYLLRKREVYEL